MACFGSKAPGLCLWKRAKGLFGYILGESRAKYPGGPIPPHPKDRPEQPAGGASILPEGQKHNPWHRSGYLKPNIGIRDGKTTVAFFSNLR